MNMLRKNLTYCMENLPISPAIHSRPKVFTWNVHGSYLYYLSQGNFDIYIPIREDRSVGYYGRGEAMAFGNNVVEVPVEEVKNLAFDCILFQSDNNYLNDQYEILTAEQRELPRIYLEHDPPRQTPADSKHVVDDPDVLLVHVTHFNHLMWDNNRTPTRVIEHGVLDTGARYTGEINKGIVVINNIQKRGRRLGLDVFLKLRESVPLDLIGIGTENLGLGELQHREVPDFIKQYRFFFNPIRFTSLGLAVCEAMMIGMPVISLATTELVSVIQNGVSGYIHTDIQYLEKRMNDLLLHKSLAGDMGSAGRRIALERFNIARFTKDWEEAFARVISNRYRMRNSISVES